MTVTEQASKPTEQDEELREKLDIRDRLKSLSIFRHGPGFDTYELIDFILADRKRVALEARIDELEPLLLGGYDSRRHATKRIAELKAQQEEV